MGTSQPSDYLPAHARRREIGILLIVFLLSRLVMVGAGFASIQVRGMEERPDFTHLLDGGTALDM